MTLKPGDKLFYVEFEDRHGMRHREITVKSVGRKWAQIKEWYDGRRLNITTLRSNSLTYGDCGQAYRNRAEYERKCELQSAWDKFRHRLPLLPPPHLSLEQIHAIAEQCGVTIPPKGDGQ